MSEQAFQVNKQGVGTMTPAEQRSIFWRSFTIQGSWSFDKMMAYGCMYALEKPLRGSRAERLNENTYSFKMRLEAFDSVICRIERFYLIHGKFQALRGFAWVYASEKASPIRMAVYTIDGRFQSPDRFV